jgi:hypothetical protein
MQRVKFEHALDPVDPDPLHVYVGRPERGRAALALDLCRHWYHERPVFLGSVGGDDPKNPRKTLCRKLAGAVLKGVLP